MLKINDVYSILNDLAPFEISEQVIKNGGYDNSGILINTHSEINKILFSLDLSLDSVNRAKRLGCDTIITHHPAIYTPIKELSVEDYSLVALVKAIEYKMNVISMHLNLDFANEGIDENLSKALGATNAKTIEKIYQNYGYGREFCLNKTTLSSLAQKVKIQLETNRVITYGKKNFSFNKVASFCGAGSSTALKTLKSGECTADVIVTSDVPHHVIKEIVEMGKAMIIVTHYSAENYGFKKFYQKTRSVLGDQVQTYYFQDKRFI